MKKSQVRTYFKVFVNLGIMLVIILGCIFVLPEVIVYFMPFIVGWMIALIAGPLVKFFEKTLKIKRRAGSAVVIIAVIALVILVGYFAGSWLMEQIILFAQDFPRLVEAVKGKLVEVGDKFSGAYSYLPKEVQSTLSGVMQGVQSYTGNIMENAGEPTIEALGRFAQGVPNIFIGVIMSLLFAYFYLSDRDYVGNLISGVLPKAMIERFEMIKRSFSKAVSGYFKAQFKIEFWMYFLLAIGFSILGIDYAFIIAIGVAILDLLPFFGTGTVLLPWATVEFFSGDYTMVIGLLIIWGVGQLARQIIQPKIVGDSVGLAPIPTLLLLYVGYKSAGVMGMIIAVPVGIIVLNMYEEGVFDTTINSLKVLYAGISNFRHLTEEDMQAVERYKEEEMRSKEREEKRNKE